MIADNLASYSLVVIPERVKDIRFALNRLKDLLALKQAELDDFLKRYK